MKTKERPIIFSGEMVRAILAGRKTQTRRVVKPQPIYGGEVGIFNRMMTARDGEGYPGPDEFGFFNEDQCIKCPYGQPGDRLWVRETFDIDSFGAGVAQIRYRADNSRGMPHVVSDSKLSGNSRCVSSIHMPRHCSRITLEVVDVRVERLLKITEKDAIAEGVVLTAECLNRVDATVLSLFHSMRSSSSGNPSIKKDSAGTITRGCGWWNLSE